MVLTQCSLQRYYMITILQYSPHNETAHLFVKILLLLKQVKTCTAFRDNHGRSFSNTIHLHDSSWSTREIYNYTVFRTTQLLKPGCWVAAIQQKNNDNNTKNPPFVWGLKIKAMVT